MRNFLQRCSVLFIPMFLLSLVTFAQSTVRGHIVDAITKEALTGATVVVKGTTKGGSVGLDGSFKIEASNGSTLVITYIGYISKEVNVTGADLGTITLDPSSGTMKEVVVTGNTISVAIDRKTPIAVSSVNQQFIEEKLGSQEFPEILKSVPGIQVTRQGGGFGDSRLSVRGFKQANVAVMINGMPVNDMENGAVFWSNWTALSDVTTSMQAQRGLGASKVAVPSLGGTVNILTRNTDAQKGGSLLQSIGTDGYQKTAFSLSTGLTEKGWAFTVFGAKTQGNGNADGLNFVGYNYFANVSKILTPNQTLSLTIVGAQQTHGQRTTRSFINDYRTASSGIRYNPDFGYRDGQIVNGRNNFYTKPVAQLNHNWNINSTSSLSTVVYASKGTGGGGNLSTGLTNTTNPTTNNTPKTGDIYSPIDFDAIVNENVASPTGATTKYLRASRNDHEWYGALSTYKKKLNESIDLLAGADLRYYIGRHFTEVTDLLGARYVSDNTNLNTPNYMARKGDKILYNNDSNVWWQGGFLQAEYSKNDLSAFVSVAGSNTSYRRIDHFLFLDSDPNQTTKYFNYFGYQAKGGANYNLDSHHNVFANVGYLSRAPFFNSAFLNNTNNINPVVANEKLFSVELGYGYRSSIFSANVNLYRTNYKDRNVPPRQQTQNGQTFSVNITGLDELHQGVEFDFKLRPVKDVTLSGSLSVGDWKYTNNVGPVQVFNDANEAIGSPVYYNLKGVKVGDQAQTTGALNLDVNVTSDLKIGGNWNYYGNYYADFSYTNAQSTSATSSRINTWKIPDYHLFDLNAVFKFKLAGLNSEIIGNMNNVFNTNYVSDALDSNNTGLAASSLVYYGIGRTITTTLKVKF